MNIMNNQGLIIIRVLLRRNQLKAPVLAQEKNKKVKLIGKIRMHGKPKDILKRQINLPQK
jgi:hypothetical protein